MINNHNTIIIIPSRMASTRLPGKPMADINGKPMIIHVWEKAVAARIGEVLVAAADEIIAQAVRKEGGDAVVTTLGLPSGSDRIAEALSLRDPQGKFRFVVNLQGDLPTIDALSIQRCLSGLSDKEPDISTIASLIADEKDVANPNIVKLIAPLSSKRRIVFASDFLRKLSPNYPAPFWHHIGIYAYRRASLEQFVRLPVSAHEAERKLEQMRALDNGMKIAAVLVETVPLGVDTHDDLETARKMLRR